jgi:hypothetical protein
MSLCIRTTVDLRGAEDDETDVGAEQDEGIEEDEEHEDGEGQEVDIQHHAQGDAEIANKNEEFEKDVIVDVLSGINDNCMDVDPEKEESGSTDHGGDVHNTCGLSGVKKAAEDMPDRSTEVLDVGGSFANTCRAVLPRLPMFESQANDIDKENVMAEAAAQVNRMSLGGTPRTAATYAGTAAIAQTSSLSSRLRPVYNNPVATPLRALTPVHSATPLRTPASRRGAAAGKHGGRPPLPSQTPTSSTTARIAARRKVSEVAEPVHQRPKRARRGTRAHSQAENVSACF